jgi:hypothetical protein
MIVRLWTVKSDVPVDRQEWKEVCDEEEASREASLKGTSKLFLAEHDAKLTRL